MILPKGTRPFEVSGTLKGHFVPGRDWVEHVRCIMRLGDERCRCCPNSALTFFALTGTARVDLRARRGVIQQSADAIEVTMNSATTVSA